MRNENYKIERKNNNLNIEINSIPTLYKYQPVNDYSIKNLINEEIWGTVPAYFNDPYDTVFCYDEKLLRKEVESLCDFEMNIRGCILSDEDRRKYVEESLIQEKQSIDIIRNNIAVSCFSEDVSSEIMWAHYADCAKGYAIEYDGNVLCNTMQECNNSYMEIILNDPDIKIAMGDKIIEQISKSQIIPLAPVLYCNKKYNITKKIVDSIQLRKEQIIKILNSKINNKKEILLKCLKDVLDKNEHQELLIYNALLNKSKVWSYEKEWRIFGWFINFSSIDSRFSKYTALCGVKPKAIYMGEKISIGNEKLLIQIAKEKCIPIYKMKTKITKTNMKLIPELVK